MNTNKLLFIEKLKQWNIVQTGEFLLSSGEITDIYFDFRILYSLPFLTKFLLDLIEEFFQLDIQWSEYDLICGVPTGGLLLATALSLKNKIPQIYCRDGKKPHGNQKQIEGLYSKGMKVLLIEDVITTGKSVEKVKHTLEQHGLEVVDILTIVNRSKEFDCNSIFTMDEIVKKETISWSNELQMLVSTPCSPLPTLYSHAFTKKSNLVISLCDFFLSDIPWIEAIQDKIVGIKFHRIHFNPNYYFANRDFVLIYDAKLADIPSSNIENIKKYSEYIDYITYHPAIVNTPHLDQLKKSFPKIGMIGVVEMSIDWNVYPLTFMDKIKKDMTKMDGCVLQEKALTYYKDNKVSLPITFSPGIHLEKQKDGMGQHYTDGKRAGEFWIVGRGITENQEMENIEKYQEAGWKHFMSFEY